MTLVDKISNLYNLNEDSIRTEIQSSDLFIYTIRDDERSKSAREILNDMPNGRQRPYCIELRSSEEGYISEVHEYLDQIKGKQKISLDITYVERNMMASLFAEFSQHVEKGYSLDINIIYALAKYTPPIQSYHPNDKVAPAHPRFSGWYAKPQYPVIAIVGLGYEKDKALGAIEYIEADDKYLFIPTSSEKNFLQSVNQQNATLIESTNDSHLITYNVHDPVESIHMLNSIVIEAKKKYKPVLFPFGPKILFSAALIVALVHPEASVWYVSGEVVDNIQKDQETSQLIGYRFDLSK